VQHDDSKFDSDAKFGTTLPMRKAIIVCKTARYEYEYLQHQKKEGKLEVSEEEMNDPNSDSNRAIKEELLRRGLRFSMLHESYEAHQRSVEVMKTDLKSAGVDCEVIKTADLTPSHLEGIDVAFAAGGDGTVLALAQMINSPHLPVIGVNTDPDRSKGALCSIRMHSYIPQSCGSFAELLRRLESGDFDWKLRNRMRVRIFNPDSGHESALGGDHEGATQHLALNEIFFAERDASKPASHEIQIDGGEPETCRSSGVIVCTGSGSTAWMTNAVAIHQDDVERILEQAGTPRTGLNLAQITQRVNSALHFDPQSPYMEFLVREPVVNPAVVGLQGTRRGFARRVELRALGWDTIVAADAIPSATSELPYGSRVVLDIDPANALRTVHLGKRRDHPV
jgi:NAD+ kinase